MNPDNDPYQALRFRDFRWLLFGSTFAFIAAQIQSLVLGWQVYELTHDPMSLGWIGLSEAVPFLGLTLVGGWAADRWDRRRLCVLATAVSVVGALLLVLWSSQSKSPSPWPFYAIQSLSGLSRAFLRPASQALGTELVPRQAYGNAATWRSSSFHFSMVTGPAIGGLLFSLSGATATYGVVTLLLFGGLLALFQVHPPKPNPGPVAGRATGLSDGVKFVLSNRLILSALSLDLFAVLFGGAIALLPAFAHDILRIGPAGLGLMRAAPAVGAILMAIVIAYRRPSEHAGQTLLWAVASFGICWVLFACSRSLALSLLLLTFSGAVDNISVILRATLVQTQTPPDMMGRVQAVNGFFIGSSNELGAFESGLFASVMGLVQSVIFGGCMTLVVVAVVARMVPELRRLKRVTD